MFEEVWRAYEENELSHSAAHHLMAIHELREMHGYARVSDIAKHLSITKGSVSTAMKHLKERGYVQEDLNRFLELTEQGLKVVQETEATRLVVQRFLKDALGMDEDDAMVDACKVEHLISNEARVRLVCFFARVIFGKIVGQRIPPHVPRRCSRMPGRRCGIVQPLRGHLLWLPHSCSSRD